MNITLTRTYLHRQTRRYFKPVTETLTGKKLGETPQFLKIEIGGDIRLIKKSTIVKVEALT